MTPIDNLYLSAGQSVTPEVFNALLDHVRAGRLSSVLGGQVSTGIAGASVVFRRAGGNRGARYPFQPYDVKIVGEIVTIKIRPGQLNTIIPIWGAVFLDNNPAPEVAVVTGDLYIKITVDTEGEPSEVEIINDTMPTSDDPEGGLYYWRLGLITVTTVGGVTKFEYDPLVQTSLSFGLCGGVKRIVRA